MLVPLPSPYQSHVRLESLTYNCNRPSHYRPPGAPLRTGDAPWALRAAGRCEPRIMLLVIIVLAAAAPKAPPRVREGGGTLAFGPSAGRMPG